MARVRKLMDKAGATSNPHEADAFAAKAAQLVARHRIDPARLRPHHDRADRLEAREMALGRGAYVRARLQLLVAVAEAHDASVVYESRPTGTVAYVAGYVSDLDVIDVMYTSLHQQVATQMAGERRATAAATQRYRRSFLFGYASRIHDLLGDARRIAETELAASDPGRAVSTELALRSRRRAVDDFAAASFGRTRRARRAGGAEPSAWNAGASAADRADIGRHRVGAQRALASGPS